MRSKLWHLVLILIVPLILVTIWFRGGNILGHGESGLPFYNPGLELNLFKDAWSNYTLGLPTNVSVASVPFYWLFSKFQNLGIPGYIQQAFFFWSIFAISGVSIYMFVSELFPSLKDKYLLLAVMFYWFNPFSLINVWNRFLNTFIIFYAIIPLILLLFIRGLRMKNYLYSVFIALLTVIFSYSFTAIAFSVLLWSILIFTAIFKIVVADGWRDRFFTFKFVLLTLILFGLVNLWWISQIFSNLFLGNFSTVVSDFLSKTGNYETLTLLSQRLGNLRDLIRLRHGTFFAGDGISWLQIYNSPLITILEFIVFGVVLFGVIRNRKK